MNHDDTNLNPEHDPALRPWIEPELEARIVAWVAGEASAFEIAELERLIATKPELAIFKRRIEAVQGLVAEAALPDKEILRLSPERRAKVLTAIGARIPNDATATIVPQHQSHSRWSGRVARYYYVLGGLAAACLIVVFQVSQRRESAQRDIALHRGRTGQAARELLKARSASTSTDATEFEKQPVADKRVVSSFDVPTLAEDAAATRPVPAQQGVGVRPVELPRAPVGLLAQSRQKTQSSADSPASSNAPFVDVGRLTVGGAAGTTSSSGQSHFGTVEQAPSPELPKLASKGLASDSLTLGVPGKSTEVDQLNGANARSPNRAPGDFRNDMRVTFGDSVSSTTQRMNEAPASTALPPPGAVVTFGSAGAAAKSGGGDLSTVTGSVTLGASTAPAEAASNVQAKDVITLSPFTVTAPKKNDADNVAGRETAVARTEERVFAGAKLSELKEEQAQPATETKVQADKPATTDAETNTAKESVSTFSLHVSDVSFRLAVAAAAAFERGENPKMPNVRAEEFYNAFDYGDPAPSVAEKVGARIEQSVHPVLQQRNLLRIALKVPATGRGAGQPLRLTVLLDTSGSMEREDRRLAVRRALEELIALLGPNDRVTLIGFSRQPRLLAEAVPGNQAGHLVGMSASTPAEGGTNLEQALKLASELALRHRLESAQNRIVLLTDGAANLGNADPAQLATMVETLRQQRIAFDACGIGLEGIGDNVLEALTRKGDGRYYVIDRPEAADAGFARQLAGAFRPAAENVKLQVRFNAARVGNYRLIGFEQHRLREEDFRNEKVDAAELAADEAATALYQVEVLPQGSGEIGDVYVRFRDAATGAMVERSWTIRHDAQAPRFDRATPSLQLAGVAALVAEKLNESALAKQFKLGDFAGVVNSLRGHYAREARVQELVVLYGRLRRMSGE